MLNNGNILLCDMGGTHARFAKYEGRGQYTHFKKYRLNDFLSFDAIVSQYIADVDMNFATARFAVARTPENGVIKYKRCAGDPDYEINFPALETQFGWVDCLYLNDLEAGAHGAKVLGALQTKIVIPSIGDPISRHRVLIAVGTGIGHAGIMDEQILRTAGGHHFPILVTNRHHELAEFIRKNKEGGAALIMEDFVSARGLRTIANFISGQNNDALSNPDFMKHLGYHPDAVELFFELLGLYAQNLVAIMGFYGGIYITGGVVDYLIKYNLDNWDAFARYARPQNMVSVAWRFETVPVHYVLHDELPLLGLTVDHSKSLL